MSASSRAVSLLFVAAIGCGVSKDEWLEKFEPQVVAKFCEPGMAFRTCFDVDASTCLEVTKRSLHACIEKHRAELPDRLDQSSGEKYGGLLGECAGDAYEADLRAQNRFHDSPECQASIKAAQTKSR
jgi:hypothetical protein